jgi:rhodanese-related sulfurtransferase
MEAKYGLFSRVKSQVLIGLFGLAWASTAWCVAGNQVIAVEEMTALMEFSDYSGGAIFAEQIPKDHYAKMLIIDTRTPKQFAQKNIPDAINIEWRLVLSQRAKIPKDKMVLLYCNTGILSAQAGFALRVAGWENVRILHGGFAEWVAKGGQDAHDHAVKNTPSSR